MPAKDIFHDAVRNALLKDGWTITHDPFVIQYGGVDQFVDLGAEKILAAQKGKRKIAVEVKSFAAPSPLSDFHTALGQFLDYRLALEKLEPSRILYLAVPSDTYKSFFSLQFIEEVVATYRLKLAVYEVTKEEIIKWQE